MQFALPPTLAILRQGSPGVASTEANPSSADASFEVRPALAESADSPVSPAAIWKALCGFN